MLGTQRANALDVKSYDIRNIVHAVSPGFAVQHFLSACAEPEVGAGPARALAVGRCGIIYTLPIVLYRRIASGFPSTILAQALRVLVKRPYMVA